MNWNLEYKEELICECGSKEFYAIYLERECIKVDGNGDILEHYEMEESCVEGKRECVNCEKVYENI